jgi:hypothetical protein
MLVPEVEEVATAILEQRRPAIAEADGAEVRRVLGAVRESKSSGRRVTLGTPPRIETGTHQKGRIRGCLR